MVWGLVIVAALSGGILPRQDAPGENIERAVTEGVERIVSSVMGAPATVGGINWDREKQRLTLEDLTIANPSGFSEGNAIALGNGLEEDQKKASITATGIYLSNWEVKATYAWFWDEKEEGDYLIKDRDNVSLSLKYRF